jgi:hypothetical protein
MATPKGVELWREELKSRKIKSIHTPDCYYVLRLGITPGHPDDFYVEQTFLLQMEFTLH